MKNQVINNAQIVHHGMSSLYTHINDKTKELTKVRSYTGTTKVANTIINRYENFSELIYYKKDFEFQTDKIFEEYNMQNEKIMTGNLRKFFNENGVLQPVDENVFNIEKLKRTIYESCRRAKDNFYGYGLSNIWKYFLTLTFDPKIVNRNDDNAIKLLYKIFRQKLQRINKNVRLLAVPERHDPTPDYPNGALHFHCLVGDIDLDQYLTKAINIKTNKLQFSKFGEQIYNLSIFTYGFSTLVKFPKDYDDLRVINYCIGYTTKASNIGYNQKKYYRTLNLNYKTKIISHQSKEAFYKLINNIDTVKYKETNDIIVFRVYQLTQKNV